MLLLVIILASMGCLTAVVTDTGPLSFLVIGLAIVMAYTDKPRRRPVEESRPRETVLAGTVHIGTGKCPVCSEEEAGKLTQVCSLCRTPHHVECWSYNGGCAVYGCGNRRTEILE
jgi:hypothetical protein